MKTREEIITDMCYTYRHDYGLDTDTSRDGWPGGLTQQEREHIWRMMSQIFDNSILPNMDYRK